VSNARPLRKTLAAAVLAAAALVPASTAQGGDVTLTVLVGGNGTVTATAGATSVSCGPVASSGEGCTQTFPRGSSVRLDAVPGTDPGRAFAGWSVEGCAGTGPCTVTLDDGLTVVARFPPFRLIVLTEGAGIVTRSPPGDACADPTACTATYSGVTEVELRADGATPEWGLDSWCVRDGPVCRATVDFDPFYVGVGFLGQFPPSVPFDVESTVTVAVTGDGTVRGEGLDCPPDCTGDPIDYKQPVVLTATAGGGARFARWVGVCATDERCEFRSGTITRVRALFEAPPPPPPPLPPSPRCKLSTRIASVGVARANGARVVRVGLVTNVPAAATLRLVRRGATLAQARYAVARGRSQLRLRLARRVRPGWSTVVLNVRGACGSARLTRPLRLPGSG
jgi:hypothetical protein